MGMRRAFISYFSRDVGLARVFEGRLRKAGIDTWRDETRLESDWSKEIAYELANYCDVVCLLWTAAASGSRWVRHEWLTARALEKHIVPCLFPGGPDLPEPLANVHGIIVKSPDAGAKKLIERVRTLPLGPPRYDYTILPQNSFVLHNPNPDFVGRHTDLLELYLKMIGNLHKIGLNQGGLVGMGGIGKTQLEVEFAYRYSFAFRAVYWIDARDSTNRVRDLVRLSRDRLRLVASDKATPEAAAQALFALQEHSKNNPGTLLLMDNVEDPKLLNSEEVFRGIPLTVLSLGADLLFTTRRRFSLPGVAGHAVDVLSPEAAYTLLTAHHPPATTVEIDHAKAVANALGYLPLAIVLVAGYLNKYPSVSFADYRSVLLQKKLSNIDLGVISEAELATRHRAAVRATLEEQWLAVDQEPSRRLFLIAGQSPESSAHPKARLGCLAGIPQPATPIDRPLDRAFAQLELLSLVEPIGSERRHARLHPLVREFAADLLTAEASENLRREASDAVANAYADPLRLAAELQARGVVEVIGDVRAALSWAPDHAALKPLERLLDRERPHLIAPLLGHPESVFRQLHHRAQIMGLPLMAHLFLTAAGGKSAPVLRTVTARPFEAVSLMRGLWGHQNVVQGVAFVDHVRAVSASWDGTLILWNVATGEAERVLRGQLRLSRLLPPLPMDAGQYLAAPTNECAYGISQPAPRSTC